MALRKQKSRKQQVGELAVDYLKIKTASKAAKGAGKGAKKAAKGTAVYKVAKKTPVVKRIPVVDRRGHRHARRGEDRPRSRELRNGNGLTEIALIPAPAALQVRPGESFRVEDPTALPCTFTGGPRESYRLTVTSQGVALEAADEAGHARALATLRQLGPDVPGLVIEDSPRYPWRGVMLDVARHFFGVDDVLRFIDLAALYKLNVVHLHLTDDQGWRIEIPSWPLLTSVGGETQVGGGAGGFFTQADYARIVEHAAAQHVTIVPEIDVPGHVNAALRAYPELWGRDAPEPFTTWSSPGHSLDVASPRSSCASWTR